MMDTNYLCEQKLKRENPQLHKRVADSVVCVERMLVKYQNIFPTYTDHTALHSINIIDFCNRLIGKNIDQMNADEIYVLLMGAYLHDSGMGITMSDYENFRKKIDFGDYFDTHDQENIPDIIRDFHQEFSGEYIKKYTEIFDIPSQEHLFAIVQVARGHRKTDLWDTKEYPEEICLPSGNKIHLPYLAALIRLADELDIAADRNLQFLYDAEMIDNEYSKMEFKKHQAIRQLNVNEDSLVMIVDRSDENVYQGVLELKEKLDQTFQECRKVIRERTPYRIAQREILIQPYNGLFLGQAEMDRLAVQGKLLSEYEQPVYQKVMNGRSGLTLLDVGCNNVWKTKMRFLSENFKKIIGIDCLNPLIEQAQIELKDNVFSFYTCDVIDADFTENLRRIMQQEKIDAFDIIHCSFVLMHTERPEDILKKLRPFLAEDGKLIVIEADDMESSMVPDTKGLFQKFLELLLNDPYAGKRTIGAHLPQLLSDSGYADIKCECSKVCSSGKEKEKKEQIFETYCSFLPEDLLLLGKESKKYQHDWEWVNQNFDKLHEQMTGDEAVISMGVKIYTCRGESISKGQRGM